MYLMVKHLFLLICLFALHLVALGQWTTFAPMPTARWGPGVVGENGRLYAVSGNGSTANEAYNPATNTWQALAPIPISTAYPAIASWAGKVYVIGGANGSTWLSNNQIYDIATNTWSAGAPIPSNRMGASAVADNGRIYVSHGWNGVLMNSLAIYDIASNTWSVGANAPQARYQTGAGLIAGRMYTSGGYTSTWVGTTEAYDIASNTWQAVAPIPTGRYLHAVGSDGTNLHVSHGYTGTAANSYYTYAAAGNVWTLRPNAPTARYRVAGAVLDGCFYVAGGFNGAVTVATLEGNCGWGPLDGATPGLAGALDGSWTRLNWEWPEALEASRLWVERSIGGHLWENVGMTDPADGHWEELAPQLPLVMYRLAWTTMEGDLKHTQAIELTTAAQGLVTFEQEDGVLRVRAGFTAQAVAGMHTELVAVDGKVLRRGQVALGEKLVWDITDISRGLYLVRWTGPGGTGAERVWIP